MNENIEVRNIHPIQKGSLLASCDVYIKPWHIILKDVKIFEKGASRWIGMPCKETIDGSGAKIYKEMIEFDSEGPKTRFRAQIMSAIDQYLDKNPEMKAPDVITDEDLPF